MSIFTNYIPKESGFQHTKQPFLFEGQQLESTLFEFIHDAFGYESTRRWGEDDYVYPSDCFSRAHEMLTKDKYLNKYRKDGVLEFTTHAGAVDKITLIGPITKVEQTLYFYDA